MANATPRIGGTFAPPIDAELLSSYRKIAAGLPDSPVADGIRKLCDMVETFQQTPASPLQGTPHPVGRVRTPAGIIGVPMIVPLEESEVKRIWDAVPWEHEIDALGKVFDSIPNETDKPTRDAAFHLLWFARELSLDREPMTTDRLV